MRAALIVAASATLVMGLEEPQSVAYATAQVRIKLATSQARLADPWGCARARPATLGDCFGMRCLMFGIFTYFRLFYIIIYCTVPSQKSVIKPSERLANSILPHLCIVITRSAFDTRLQRGRSKRRETALNH